MCRGHLQLVAITHFCWVRTHGGVPCRIQDSFERVASLLLGDGELHEVGWDAVPVPILKKRVCSRLLPISDISAQKYTEQILCLCYWHYSFTDEATL